MSRAVFLMMTFLAFALAVPTPAFAGRWLYDECRQEDMCVRQACEMNVEARDRGLPYFYEPTGHVIYVNSSRWGTRRPTCSSPPRRVPMPAASRPIVTAQQGDLDAPMVDIRAATDAYIQRMKAEEERADAEARRADAEAARAREAAAALQRVRAAAAAQPAQSTTPPGTSSPASVKAARDLYRQMCLDSTPSPRCPELKRIMEGGAQ